MHAVPRKSQLTTGNAFKEPDVENRFLQTAGTFGVHCGCASRFLVRLEVATPHEWQAVARGNSPRSSVRETRRCIIACLPGGVRRRRGRCSCSARSGCHVVCMTCFCVCSG